MRSYRTVSPLPQFPEAVYFLLHFPWSHDRSVLPTTLSFGARTFLSTAKADQRSPDPVNAIFLTHLNAIRSRQKTNASEYAISTFASTSAQRPFFSKLEVSARRCLANLRASFGRGPRQRYVSLCHEYAANDLPTQRRYDTGLRLRARQPPFNPARWTVSPCSSRICNPTRHS